MDLDTLRYFRFWPLLGFAHSFACIFQISSVLRNTQFYIDLRFMSYGFIKIVINIPPFDVEFDLDKHVCSMNDVSKSMC